ncbi:chemotaxis protein CheR [Sinorhizobium fredii USDA 205]|uniref:Protein-glutamate O-methyltransferase CheR n=1 Tax=Rhizobium fredii TaxID=380 RepID=A0A844A4V1_RHIFR|nr:protein-glutamate O-methyltransferase CheR [Sinorhizobium fredii]ASY72085.1 Chemotaxis protein methyltransferase CheR [Sinorhizobium fredii CCBAU 83666]KSV84294.1 chemotaxis protein CheR [Sinorhizobium fredii USDA 205]MQX08139.1 protein-glutamate O-methyltransferase CheR [Sinorhizobium fredii]GEC30821.1 chemotaxis protein CheR [Sinorhizobium fredii]GLS10372.1 chemotaxis protein CheR [Sinorhizobium fredii]
MTGHALPSKLADEVACRVGIGLPASRKDVVASAIGRVMARRGIDDSSLFLHRLGLDQDLTDDVIAAITVGETHFFRDPDQFQLISQAILPELRLRRPDGSLVRIWSVGCATGEEPYSLAILCDEEGLLQDVRISAADVSRRALATAKAAEYGEWSLRNTDRKLKDRYFTSGEGRFRLNERLRRQVGFAHLNLGAVELPAPERGLADFDLILCRNVLVYLDASTVRRIARQLFACLADGGWLLTAPTDPPLWKYAPFETSITSAGVVYRRMIAHGDAPRGSTAGVASILGHKKPVAHVSPPRACGMDERKTPDDKAFKAIARQIRWRYELGETREAQRLAAQAVQSHPLSAELHFLQGLSQMADGQTDAAAAALRRVVYLDARLAAAQFFLGVCLTHSDPQASQRAFENVLQFCLSRPPRERVALMSEATAGDLAERARREIGKIQRGRGSKRL